ncbi:hypothetical protein SLEP1_g49799 [Rubroshorea leprosula]|uniref:Secreted protein n=1 Tax=Rubroshorea leprosula TaxID=152421 RepID=A0AAV5LY90_9ROSI|nr:hypothetical protein SLEP1_g49799 [Rubroshorea leprosula]
MLLCSVLLLCSMLLLCSVKGKSRDCSVKGKRSEEQGGRWRKATKMSYERLERLPTMVVESRCRSVLLLLCSVGEAIVVQWRR